MRREYKHNTLAIIYDFDGTLSPQPMQEYTILPKIGIRGKSFWAKAKKESERTDGEGIVTYMRLMLEMAAQSKIPITRRNLGKLASKIKYFLGVEGYFKRINEYVKEKTDGKILLKHYIISAGLKEILEKTSIKRKGYIHKIFACEYYYDHNGVATFPNIIVNDTLKTQFLFRINKGKEKLNESINEHMPMTNRTIPFTNMLYIGDGLTDVPCMAVVTKEGGYAIAVYRPRSHKGLVTCKKLFNDGRVNLIAKANYNKNTELDLAIKNILDTMIQGVKINKAIFKQYCKYIEGGNNVRKE